ncbi:hypothetical protein [Streptomyces cylindrosporus]|uniref:Uncharacterized protein n=1 Tax=Streptomyces cylindrosporus TaxID=2927583 RepID=A0ABS9YK38_9ACTN|nr:hypothetical protein [Streptomyces cylindrosporus]MCI3277625.1 hypothetical protein [Streptomyces cylindrosporus]
MTEPPEIPREQDWWDRLYPEAVQSPDDEQKQPAEPEIANGPTADADGSADETEDDAPDDDSRPRLLNVILGRSPGKTKQREREDPEPEEPECAHEHTVPVHAQPYGELVAMLCLDCDEQLPVPEPADEDAEQATARPAVVPKPNRRGRTPTSKRPQRRSPAAVGRSYVRPIAFTLSAGLFGYSIGLVDVMGSFLTAADHGATGAAGTFLALASGYASWRVLGIPGVAGIVPAGIVGRAIAAVFVASVAPGLAPDAVQILNQYGAYVGLDASAVALLATSTALCGGLYWLVDRRFKAMPLAVRWLVRIPLASAALAVALYAPGPR